MNTQYRCQSIVVDELQDFNQNIDLIPAIARLTRPVKGYFLGLYDPNQAIDNSNFDPQELKKKIWIRSILYFEYQYKKYSSDSK